jgi:hypothetical protein
LKSCLYAASPKLLRQRPHSKLNPQKVNAIIKVANILAVAAIFPFEVAGRIKFGFLV